MFLEEKTYPNAIFCGNNFKTFVNIDKTLLFFKTQLIGQKPSGYQKTNQRV